MRKLDVYQSQEAFKEIITIVYGMDYKQGIIKKKTLNVYHAHNKKIKIKNTH